MQCKLGIYYLNKNLYLYQSSKYENTRSYSIYFYDECSGTFIIKALQTVKAECIISYVKDTLGKSSACATTA